MSEIDEKSFSFKLGRKLGEGSYGLVYECKVDSSTEDSESVSLDSSCAVKVVKKTEKGGIESPLELSIMATYRHPYLGYATRIIDNGSFFYIVQELAESDLEIYLQSHQARDNNSWFVQLLQAVDFLHSEEIIHCDIKPSNVLVMNDGTVRLTDYSHSVLLAKPGESFRRKVGSPRYSAPEVLLGKLWSKPIDIWSLGCVFYEMSTEVRFLDDLPTRVNDSGIVAKIEAGSFRRAEFKPKEDKELIIDYMLQMNPKERYTSAEILKFYFENPKRPKYGQLTLANCQNEKVELPDIIQHGQSQAVLNMISLINSKTPSIPVTLVKLEACFILAKKLLEGACSMTSTLSSPNSVQKMELEICKAVGFLLHTI
jgi:serine/threonine protein kinase